MRRRFGAFIAMAALLAAGAPAAAHDPGTQPGGGGNGSSHDMTLVAEFPSGEPGSRPTNSDIAFWGRRAYVGNYNGFRIFDISGRVPTLLADMRCAGAQGDPSVADRDGNGEADLLVLSVDRTLSGPGCSAVPVAHDDPTGWEGLRLFDVSDPRNPRHIGSVYQDCGSHTNTLLPAGDRLFVLNSSYPLRPGPTCGPVRGPQAGRDPLHGVVQVVEIDLANPAASREVTELPITYPGDADNRFKPSEHGLSGGGLLDGMRACHDLAVFTELGLVAGACAEQAQLWRIDKKTGLPDTTRPVWVFDQPNVDFWHSATFSWDGKVVNFIDESFGDGCPTKTKKLDLTTPDPNDEATYETGNMFFLKTTNGKLLSEYRLPEERATPGDAITYCSSHLGNVVPATDRYLLVNAYYRGGTSVIDFSDPTDPREVAFHDAANADTWSAYWYETGSASGPMRVWANDGVHDPNTGHGFQAFLAHVEADRVPLDRLNPQLQERTIKTKIAKEWRYKDGNPRTFAKGRPSSGRATGSSRAANRL